MSVDSIKNIIIIEDTVDYRKLLISFFKKVCPSAKLDEYDPANGRPPDSFAWDSYDLVILDYDLGGGENGLEWLRHYKTSIGFPPTIMLTAKDDEELVVKAIRYGAQGFLRKVGLTKNKLLNSISEAINKYEEEKETATTSKIQAHNFNKEKFFESLNTLHKNDAVILVEIDKFQDLRETLGIFSTDNFVNFFTEVITKTINSSSCDGQMTRIGDSTIALLVTGKSYADIENLAKLLCSELDKTDYKNNEEPVDFFVNIGIVIAEKDQPDVAGLLSSVENACRKARENKGNSYEISGGTVELPDIDKQFSKEIIRAINDNHIQPLFQSLVLVSGTPHKEFKEIYQIRGNILGKDNNILEPKKFIPILERAGAIKKMDRWNIRHCVAELSNLIKKDGPKYGIFIPLSLQSINDKDLTDWIYKLTQHVKIPEIGKSLIFECRANDFISSSRQAKLQFNKLRVKLHSSVALTSIYDKPTLEKCITQEKFDFVLFSPEHTGKEKMTIEQLQGIVDTAKKYKSITVASRIDTGEYLALSASVGVDYVLGHFVQPPMEKIMAAGEVEVIQ